MRGHFPRQSRRLLSPLARVMCHRVTWHAFRGLVPPPPALSLRWSVGARGTAEGRGKVGLAEPIRAIAPILSSFFRAADVSPWAPILSGTAPGDSLGTFRWIGFLFAGINSEHVLRPRVPPRARAHQFSRRGVHGGCLGTARAECAPNFALLLRCNDGRLLPPPGKNVSPLCARRERLPESARRAGTAGSRVGRRPTWLHGPRHRIFERGCARDAGRAVGKAGGTSSGIPAGGRAWHVAPWELPPGLRAPSRPMAGR